MASQTFSAEYKNLLKIGEFVLTEAKKVDFNSKELYAIELSVIEACENIIDHAYHGENLGNIDVSAESCSESFCVILKDQGTPFNPDEVPSPDVCSPLEIRSERGLGIYTMCKLMDEVRYDFSEPGVNILVMVKNRQAMK
ncbi:MAG: ATP-binding protein [Anaerolineaceae bacterium]